MSDQALQESGGDARAQLRAFALTFPEAYEDYPWGEVVVKVQKKVFVFLGSGTESTTGFSCSVKLPASGADVLALPFAEPTGYGLGKSGWVTLRFEPGEQPPLELLQQWVAESYRAVAPKRILRTLEPPA